MENLDKELLVKLYIRSRYVLLDMRVKINKWIAKWDIFINFKIKAASI